ncbi:MAG: pyridoxamine 5'-phosphate oxidase family protein, partial [Erysipelotrichaceae bacterium]|nr:pyridoxamine 5'-phosphate oxidase family protein [Erysipelotrichaceae bacterium]
VTDMNRIIEIIRGCHCCRVAFCDEGVPYIVPLNFGFEVTEGRMVFWFHSAKEGRKTELMKKNPTVGFELDRGYSLVEAELPCAYTAKYQSVIGTGTISSVDDKEAKKHALGQIMLQSTGKADWEFDSGMMNAVLVYRLDVKEISCKENG